MPPLVNARDLGETSPKKDELGDRLGTSNETGEISPNHPHEVSSDKDNYFTVPFGLNVIFVNISLSMLT